MYTQVLIWVGSGIAALAITGTVIWTLRRDKKKQIAMNTNNESDKLISTVPDSTSNSVPPAVADVGSKTTTEITTPEKKAPPAPPPRELRLKTRGERVEQQLCLYCDLTAIFQTPSLEVVRPNKAIDWLYRHFNIKALDRWKVVLWRGLDIPFELCKRHHERARGLLEKKIAEIQTDYAEFIDRKRREMYEYELFGMDEQIDKDQQEIIKPSKNKKRQNQALPDGVSDLSARRAQASSQR